MDLTLSDMWYVEWHKEWNKNIKQRNQFCMKHSSDKLSRVLLLRLSSIEHFANIQYNTYCLKFHKIVIIGIEIDRDKIRKIFLEFRTWNERYHVDSGVLKQKKPNHILDHFSSFWYVFVCLFEIFVMICQFISVVSKKEDTLK